VNQLPGAVPLVATDHLAGGPVHPRQPVDPQSGQYPVHRRRWDSQSVADAGRPELERPSELLDLRLHGGSRLVGAGPGPARAVHKADGAELVPTVPPLVGRRPGDPHLSGHVGHWSTCFDPHDHRQSADRSQPGVSVHLSPPGSSVGVLDSSTLLLGAHLIGGPVLTTFVVTTARPRGAQAVAHPGRWNGAARPGAERRHRVPKAPGGRRQRARPGTVGRAGRRGSVGRGRG
jgi:hypothetical protein